MDVMDEARFSILMCDQGFLCKAVAMSRPIDVRQPVAPFQHRDQFTEVAEWCVEFLGSNHPLERWVINHKEMRVYFYNLDDATLFKLRWC